VVDTTRPIRLPPDGADVVASSVFDVLIISFMI
jgi:hypothetical protein